MAEFLGTWREAGREVAVIGLARSGVAATRLLLARGFAVYASDIGAAPALEHVAAELRGLGASVDVGRHDLSRVAASAGVVLSPGVPPDVPPVVAARDAGVGVLSEVDVGLQALPGTRYVAVTGTNGKTTTTALLAHLMREAGFDSTAAGNIGKPVCQVALEPTPPSWLALEVSSFQLHDCPHIDPAVGILTNLAPNHLDRYQTLADYYADKGRLFVNAGPRSVWVTNADNADSQALVRGVAGTHLRFSVRGRADGWYDRDSGTLMLGDEPLLPRDSLQLLGDHNVENALAASLALRNLGATPDALAEGLRGFRALTHRLEPVRTVHGVLWINDSKSTNVTSTDVAIAALDRPFVLLLGGRHKGEPYTRLAERMGGRCRGVVAYGESRELITRDLGSLVPVIPAGPFDEVIARARDLARPGDAVLLSPACSSYDMFHDYEDRGARFRAAVEAL